MKLINGRLCIEMEGKCKFCQKELTLYIDASYDGVRDPMGLVKMAACDRCGDYRSERSQVEDRISKICCQIRLTKDGDTLGKIRERLVELSRDYAKSLCDYLRSPTLHWSKDLGEEIYRQPDNWPNILKRYRMETFTEIRKELHE